MPRERCSPNVGTVYRHFPDRQALVEAAAEHRFAEIEQYARAYCFGESSGLGALPPVCRRALAAEVIAHDQATGRLRSDCTVADAYLLVGALSARFLDLLRDQLST